MSVRGDDPWCPNGASVLRAACSSPFLHPQHLVSVLLPQLGVNALVDAHGVHGESDGQQAVHLLVLFVYLSNMRLNVSRLQRGARLFTAGNNSMRQRQKLLV